ncbi:hypothetical protein ECZU28_36970 [Escherichia coli]|nr:hypothetical protein ECZU28_36970 [Escherichia coli]
MARMNMWDSPMPTKREAWAGCLTLPRELLNAMVVCVSVRFAKPNPFAGRASRYTL